MERYYISKERVGCLGITVANWMHTICRSKRSEGKYVV
jgi:hypothetical protein